MRRDLEEISRKNRNNAIQKKLPDELTVRVKGPFIYGYSITIGPDGKPLIREFGNMKPSTGHGRPRIDIREEMEPLVDVMESEGEMKVIAELPGVEKRDIKLHGTETTLTISVDTPNRKYCKEVELPVEVTPKKMKSSYRNGVLEVTLPKRRRT